MHQPSRTLLALGLCLSIRCVLAAEEPAEGDDRLTPQIVDPDPTSKEVLVASDIYRGFGPGGDLLRSLWAAGQAAGNHGDRYENADGGHARFMFLPDPKKQFAKPLLFPQVEILPIVQCRNLDTNGPADGWPKEPPASPGPPTLCNASNMFLHPMASVPNFVFAQQDLCMIAWRQYRGNVHCFHPSVFDVWRPGKTSKPFVIRMLGMMPYMTTSRSMSSSEFHLMREWYCGMAALRPDVKKTLVAEGLLMPVMQMLFRRARVPDEAAYLTPRAHPFAFVGFNGGRDCDSRFPAEEPHMLPRLQYVHNMVSLAQAITPETIPPLAMLQVVDDAFPQAQHLCTTPAAIGRRILADQKGMRLKVSAAPSLDLNKRPLAFHWAILVQDGSSVRLSAEQGVEVDISFDYAKPFPHGDTPGTPTVNCSTMVVACFAHNGAAWSPPAFINCTSFDLGKK